MVTSIYGLVGGRCLIHEKTHSVNDEWVLEFIFGVPNLFGTYE